MVLCVGVGGVGVGVGVGVGADLDLKSFRVLFEFYSKKMGMNDGETVHF